MSVVGGLLGFSVLNLFVLQFGDAEYDLRKLGREWREKVLTDVSGAQADGKRRKQRRAAALLYETFRTDPRPLRDAFENLAAAVGQDPDQLLRELPTAPTPEEGLRAMARFIANTSLDDADDLVRQATRR
jgi:hypothetical protein